VAWSFRELLRERIPNLDVGNWEWPCENCAQTRGRELLGLRQSRGFSEINRCDEFVREGTRDMPSNLVSMCAPAGGERFRSSRDGANGPFQPGRQIRYAAHPGATDLICWRGHYCEAKKEATEQVIRMLAEGFREQIGVSVFA
jgi:hypothetical protein